MKHLCFTALVILAMGAILIAPTGNAQTKYNTYANDAVATLMQTSSGWYSSADGEWSPPNWWVSGVSTYALTDYERLYNDNTYESSVIANNFAVAPVKSGNTNFMEPVVYNQQGQQIKSNYFDDDGWWAEALLNYYDLTGNTTCLTDAETMFNGPTTVLPLNMTDGWTQTECYTGDQNGMNWATNSIYQNAISNELFLDVAARLYNRTGDPTYLDWAEKEWAWFQGSGTILSSNIVNDGLNSVANGCTSHGNVFTYNQGVILSGLLELFWANHDESALSEAQTIAKAVLNSENLSTPLVTYADGILDESAPSGGIGSFKGVSMRNLMKLNQFVPDQQYLTFVDNNADSIFANDKNVIGSLEYFGYTWQGPFVSGEGNFVNQTAALSAFNAAISAEGYAAIGPIQRNEPGEEEMFLVDTSGGVWHDWQKQNVHGASDPSNWSGFTAIAGITANQGAAVTEDNFDQQTVFVPTSGDVFYESQSRLNGGWSSWTDMGSSSNGLSGLRTANGLYGEQVFGRDSSGDIKTAYLSSEPNSSWTSFTTLSGESIQPGYAVARNASGMLQVFGVDSSGTLWTNVQTGENTWSGWTSISGKTVEPYIATYLNQTGNLQIFAVDSTGADLWTNWQTSPGGGWQSSWQNLGTPSGHTIQPGFVVGNNSGFYPEVFAVGNDGNVYHAWNNGGWTGWSSLGGGPLNPHLAVITSANGWLQVFAVGSSSPYNIYSNWQTGGGSWNTSSGAWTSFGGGGKTFFSGQL